MVLTFITIAVPVQLNGNWVTLIWTSEAALLFIIGRYKNIRFYEWLGLILLALAAISLMQDWGSYYGRVNYDELSVLAIMPVFSITFFTSLFFTAALTAMTSVHIKKAPDAEQRGVMHIYRLIDYMLPCMLLLFAYITFYNEINIYFSSRYRQSEVTDPVYSWDYSWTYFGTVAINCYNFIFFSIATVLVIRKWKSPLVDWASLGFNLFIAIIFLFSGMDALARLREAYLDPEINSAYPASYWQIDVRYVCFALFALLLWLTHILLKKETFAKAHFAKIYNGCIVHFFILVLLSSELINISVLSNYTKNYNYYHDTHTAYKLGFTCLWGLYSFLLIALGIFRRNRIMRISAISLFGITLIKLVTYDTWDLSTGYKIIAFILLGAILLIVAFLYQKFKQLIFGEDQPETTANTATTDEN